jgi:hypothetical protein
VHRRWRDMNSVTRRRGPGRASLTLSARTLRAGPHRVVVRAEDGAHNRSRRAVRRFRVLAAN